MGPEPSIGNSVRCPGQVIIPSAMLPPLPRTDNAHPTHLPGLMNMYDSVCGRPVPGEYRANINDSRDAFIPSLVMVVTLSSAPSAGNTITSSQWPVLQACLVVMKSTEFQLPTRKQSKWLASSNQAPR